MENWENELTALQKKANTGTAAFLILLIVSVFTFWRFGVFGLIPAVLAVAACIYMAKNYKAFNTFYKEHVVRGILEEVFTDLEFSPKRGIPRETVYGTGMIQTGDTYSSNDLITGKYRGVGFTQSDVHIEETSTDSDGNTTSTTLFRGRWMIFDFNKEFRCDLQVVSKRFFSSQRKGGLFASKEERMDRLKMEDEDFNQKFRVYAQDEQEAFYILTPHLMEKLLALQESIKAPIMLAFTGGVLHLAVYDGKDAFEARPFSRITPEKERERILADIRPITAVVDELDLDRNMFKS